MKPKARKSCAYLPASVSQENASGPISGAQHVAPVEHVEPGQRQDHEAGRGQPVGEAVDEVEAGDGLAAAAVLDADPAAQREEQGEQRDDADAGPRRRRSRAGRCAPRASCRPRTGSGPRPPGWAPRRCRGRPAGSRARSRDRWCCRAFRPGPAPAPARRRAAWPAAASPPAPSASSSRTARSRRHVAMGKPPCDQYLWFWARERSCSTCCGVERAAPPRRDSCPCRRATAGSARPRGTPAAAGRRRAPPAARSMRPCASLSRPRARDPCTRRVGRGMLDGFSTATG